MLTKDDMNVEKIKKQSKPHQHKEDKRYNKDKQWILSRTLIDNLHIEKAIKKVLEGHYAEDVANEFGIDLELLKLKVREHKFKQMEINLLRNNQ